MCGGCVANPNKQRGTQWESAVRDYMNAELGLVDGDNRFINPASAMNVRRMAQMGPLDIGDVHAVPFVLECKNTARVSVPGFLRQAEREARNAGLPHGVAVVKVRGAGTASGRVYFTIGTWTRVRLALGLSAADALWEYGATFKVPGVHTGRWYVVVKVSSFTRLVADIRRITTT